MRFLDPSLQPFAKLAVWMLRRGRTEDRPPGAHAIALTRERRLILVRLRYAPGWRLPGGGRNGGETLEQAVLRELSEEIGMTGHGRVRPVAGLGSVMIVEDVTYRPKRWSLEVERLLEADLDALPSDLSPRAADWIGAAAQHI